MPPLAACRSSTILAASLSLLVPPRISAWPVSGAHTAPPATDAKSAERNTLSLVPLLLNDAYVASQTLDPEDKGFALCRIAYIQAQTGAIRAAKKTVEEIAGAYRKSDTFLDIAKVQIEFSMIRFTILP